MNDVNYYKQAFLHQYNLISLGFLATLVPFAFFLFPLWGVILIGLVLEMLYVTYAPSFAAFRRWAEQDARSDAREEYEEEMSERLKTVSPALRRRFQSVNQIVVGFQEKTAKDGKAALLGDVNQKLVLLRDRYLKMLLAQHELDTFVQTTDKKILERELSSVEARLDHKKLHRRIRENLRQRQGIVRKRIALLEKASSNREVLGYELDTIFDLIQLIRESSMTLADPDNLSRQIDDIMVEIESAEEALEEVSDIGYEGIPSESHDEFAEFDELLQESEKVHEYTH